jgi:aspartyl-tRNA(Asn)/glutamyl-tRNA(Gln) amidotransferase subunit A
MAADAIAFTPASRLADMIRGKEVSAVEVMRATLARAEAAQARFNCFITLCGERALAEAAAADRAQAEGRELGQLHGVPFHVKDLVNTAGVRTTFASLMHEENVPTQDAVCVARLRRAGAILIGKTTTPEFGHMPFTEAPLFGRTCNAWSGGRRCAPGGGHRCRRVDAHSRGLQRRGRLQAVGGRHPSRHGAGTVCQLLEHQPDDTHGRRLRLDAGDHGRGARLRPL